MQAAIPSESSRTISLNGDWRFKIDHLDTGYEGHPREPIPDEFEEFFRLDYQEDAAWNDLAVPGNWEIAGYSVAAYCHSDNTSAFYRKWFEVPASWEGRIVKVNFDGVQCGAEVWLNGQPVSVSEPSWGRANYHESGWTAWQADLTPQVKFGQKNLLAVRVSKSTATTTLDTGDYFFLGGIYRTVTLFSVPQTHIRDFTVRTKLLEGGEAEVKVLVDVAGASDAPMNLSMSLKGVGTVRHQEIKDRTELTLVFPNPRLWSAEHPNLYQMTIELTDSQDKPVEKVARKIGVREVSIEKSVFHINGVPVKLVGICRHDVYPTLGSALTEEVWRKDLTMMKEANFNAIRTSHYPYASRFYELCDEMGFYVLDEIPMCWCDMNSRKLTEGCLQRTRETIARDKNHPCVVIWVIGNENSDGVNQKIVADAVKELDPTRPRINCDKVASDTDVEFDDYHYPTPTRILQHVQDTARRKRWPVIYTENPNVFDVRHGADYGCLDLWEQVYERTMNLVWKHDTIGGNFLWEWQDRAVADKYPDKPANYDPESGIHYQKTKGVVDGWRNPRPGYYHVKMLNSPVVVDQRADLTSKPGVAILSIENRFSFTDLSELKATLTILRDGKPIHTQASHIEMSPLSSDKVELPLPVEGDTLRLDFAHADGTNIVTCQFQLEKPADVVLRESIPDGLGFPRFNLIGCKRKGDPPLRWTYVDRFPARLVNEEFDGTSLEADMVLEKDPETIVGRVNAKLVDGVFDYRVGWTGEKTDLQEVGWVFEMPEAYKRFSWKRQAVWSYYPETHVGRPEGTALPDTAKANTARVARPDAFDFNSTKYRCDWASLTDDSNRGLMVAFEERDRHQVRGGFADDGGYTLVVNKFCCPPPLDDLGPRDVRDLLKELTPGTVIEGSFRVGSR